MHARIAAVFVLVLVALPVAAGPELPVVINVDCDAGGDLAAALRRAEKGGDVDIRVRGTCRGNFTVRGPHVTLRGESAATTALVGAAPMTQRIPVIEFVGGGVGALRNLTVRDGYVGVRGDGWGTDLLLFGVEVHDTVVGAVASAGGLVRVIEGSLSGMDVAIEAQGDAKINIQRALIHDSGAGVVAFDESFATVSDSTIRDSRDIGVIAELRSAVGLFGTSIERSGALHVLARNRSDVSAFGGSALGSADDPTPMSVAAVDTSRLESFSAAAIYGDAYASGGSFLGLGNQVVHGGILLATFANAELFNLEVTDAIVCTRLPALACSGQVTAAQIVGCTLSEGCTSTRGAAGAEGARPVTPPTLPASFANVPVEFDRRPAATPVTDRTARTP